MGVPQPLQVYCPRSRPCWNEPIGTCLGYWGDVEFGLSVELFVVQFGGAARLSNLAHVATFVFIWPARRKFLPKLRGNTNYCMMWKLHNCIKFTHCSRLTIHWAGTGEINTKLSKRFGTKLITKQMNKQICTDCALKGQKTLIFGLILLKQFSINCCQTKSNIIKRSNYGQLQIYKDNQSKLEANTCSIHKAWDNMCKYSCTSSWLFLALLLI